MDLVELRRTREREQDKYMKLHAQNYGSTGYQRHISEYVRWTAAKKDKILDIGCGRGVAVAYLLKAGYKVIGLDITLVGVISDIKMADFHKSFVEAPAWTLPFKNGEFDYTFSADVLEHIPTELVDDVAKEIFRVTSKRTLHVVSTQPSGLVKGLHLTVKPIGWWKEALSRHNVRGIKCRVMECPEFMKLYTSKALGVRRDS